VPGAAQEPGVAFVPGPHFSTMVCVRALPPARCAVSCGLFVGYFSADTRARCAPPVAVRSSAGAGTGFGRGRGGGGVQACTRCDTVVSAASCGARMRLRVYHVFAAYLRAYVGVVALVACSVAVPGTVTRACTLGAKFSPATHPFLRSLLHQCSGGPSVLCLSGRFVYIYVPALHPCVRSGYMFRAAD
jgi:hypothetical protein